MHKLTRQFILWYGLFETFVFTGNIFGWTALHVMLRKEGIYEYLCEQDNATGNGQTLNSTGDSWMKVELGFCDTQDSILNLAYTIGSFCMGSTSFIWGFLLDKWELRTVRLIINGLITSGCILLSLTMRETSYFIFPSLVLMCSAGVPLRLANMQIADLFPEHRSTIITLYSGAFTSSAAVFVFLKYFYDAGLPWEWVCFMLVVLSGLMLPVTLFVLPAKGFPSDVQPKDHGLFLGKEKEVSSVAPCSWGTFTYIPEDAIPYINQMRFALPTTGHLEKPENKEAVKVKSSEKQKEVTTIKVPQKPLKDSLLSVSYQLHQYWFCWILLYTIIYIGTLHLWTERTASNAEESELFSKLYGLLQVFGMLLAPIAGIFMDWSMKRVSKDDSDPDTRMLQVIRSCFWPMFLTTLLEVIAQVCKFLDRREAIYISIVAVTLLRAFFISIGTAYLRIRFPPEHFNRMLGILSTTAAVSSLLQFPLYLWETSSPQSVLHVNIFDSVCLAIALIHPLLLLVTPVQKYFLRTKSSS